MQCDYFSTFFSENHYKNPIVNIGMGILSLWREEDPIMGRLPYNIGTADF